MEAIDIMDDIHDYIFTKPEILWTMVLIGSITVIGVVEFLKCWVINKKKVKWIVLFVSLIISIVISPLVPSVITVIVILWLMILAVSIIAHKTIVDGIPVLISKVMGNLKINNDSNNSNGGRNG
jgi:hypothetical protein